VLAAARPPTLTAAMAGLRITVPTVDDGAASARRPPGPVGTGECDADGREPALERLAAGEGRVEHRLGDAELPGEAAHGDGGPAVGLGEVAGGADDLTGPQVAARRRAAVNIPP
jgi:hypothetical protein